MSKPHPPPGPDAATTRTHWAETSPQAQAARRLTGLEQVQAMIAGTEPGSPIGALLGMRLEHAEHGLARMRLVPNPAHYNLGGTVHGGVTATLLDSVMGCALLTTMPRARRFSTLELKVNYLRPITQATGEVVGEARVLQSGRRTGVIEARVLDGAGTIYAFATSTCLNFDLAAG